MAGGATSPQAAVRPFVGGTDAKAVALGKVQTAVPANRGYEGRGGREEAHQRSRGVDSRCQRLSPKLVSAFLFLLTR